MPTSEAMTTSTQSMTTIADIPYATTTTPERGIVTSDASTTVSTTSSMMFASSSTMPVPPTTPAPNGTEHHGGNYTLPGNSTAFPEANHTLPSHNTPFPGANLTLPTNITYPGFNMSKPTMDNATEWQAWNMTKNTGDAYSAASIINSLALTDFCSSLLGYSTPMVTRTIPMTITQGVNATVMAGTLTSGIVNTTVTLPTTLTVTSADSAWANHRKRGAVSPLTTPAPLATLGDAAVSQACSWKAKPVNVTSTISVTTIETAYTTVYMTVPEATVPATTETETAYSTFTVNTCEPTAPSQLIKNPSFECYKAGWDVNRNGAFLFWGPTGTATSEMHAGAQSPGNSANASLPSDAGKDRSQSPGATSSGASKGQSSEDEPSAAGLAPRKAESHLHDTSSVTPCEPAYDGSTFVRLRPAAVHQPSARLGQSMGNLDTGNYWISYKYRVPEYASNNANCSLTVYINDVPIRGAAVSSLVKSTAGWTRAGGFFSIAEELAGPAYTRFEFHCPALPSKGKGKSKVERQNAGKPSGVTSSGADWASMCENWSVPRGEPLLDLDYIHMGVDDGGWAQYHEVTPHGGAADAAIVAA
ncbi:hypothetical protein PMZ80_009708 [Knufia obscura]|uniref:CBM-cenC domain-containing protein n=1 Tax=Knufia obscura TaxID=1635080 RepID=A0ABR0RD45_9EURO|nr:hypothetical protein PMZ80_009708 [Knufia obscura]